jgi:type I restriction enzyme R subunit
MIATSFWSAEGKPISAEEFLNNLFGELPNLFKDEAQLREIWSKPNTRKELLEKLDAAGYPKSDLQVVQELVNMEKSDLFDVLEYVFNGNYEAMTREERVATSQATIFALLDNKQREFIEFVLSKYVESGVEELDIEKLPILITSKYQSFEDAREVMGGDLAKLSTMFVEFQKHLYEQRVA